ncbi:MAG TPA: hypothetical protein VG123_32460 [Streptosporangiaceae bacterium]|nr:hypothetical protein [Streptosporangiaceae bacterium]
MSIWGHRDGEPPAEEAHETDPPAEAPQAQAPAEPEDQGGADPLAEVPAVDPPPAFWRAQGEAPVPFARAPADPPPLAYGHVPPEPAGTAETREPAESAEPAETREPAESPEPAFAGAPGGAPADGRQPPPEAPAPAANGSAAGPGADPLLADDVVVLAGETAAEDPAPAEPAVAEPAVAEPAASPAAAGGVTPQRWSEILTSFVDDPRGSVTMAADVVDSAVEELVNSVRARQRALGSWRGGETDTEQLRTALRDYRTFWNQVQQMSPAGDGRA